MKIGKVDMIDYYRSFNSGFIKPNTYFELEETVIVDSCIYLDYFRKATSHKQRLKAIYNGGQNVAAIKDKKFQQKLISLYERCFDIEDKEVLKLTSEETAFIDEILQNIIF